MPTGPVEYVVIVFPEGSSAYDEIAPELAALVNKETISILDTVIVTKDAAGDVAFVEFDQLDDQAGFGVIDAEIGGLIGEDDINVVGEGLAAGTTAVVLLIEDLWAASLAAAIDRSGGTVLEGARIPRDLVDVAVGELADAY
jgi:uncharacterized membrane protein